MVLLPAYQTGECVRDNYTCLLLPSASSRHLARLQLAYHGCVKKNLSHDMKYVGNARRVFYGFHLVMESVPKSSLSNLLFPYFLSFLPDWSLSAKKFG